jgi:hypothetical protein
MCDWGCAIPKERAASKMHGIRLIVRTNRCIGFVLLGCSSIVQLVQVNFRSAGIFIEHCQPRSKPVAAGGFAGVSSSVF